MKIAANPAVDSWLRDRIVEQARERLGVQLQLGRLDRNIILTRITLTDVTLRDLKGSGNSISVSRLAVAIDPYAFFRGKIVIKDLKLEGMSLDIVRGEDGAVAVDPLFPFWQAKPGTDKKSFKLGFEIENVAFMDVDLSYRDIPAGLQVSLDEVVIVLARNRFDPPDKRTIKLGAKEGNIAWRVFPKGRVVAIDSLSGVMSVTPGGLSVSRLEIDTGPLSLELSGTLPFSRGADINGDLSVNMDIGNLPWLIRDSIGVITLDGNVGGDLSSPSFRGQLNGKEVQVAGRDLQLINADIYLDPDGCTIRDGKVQYRGEELFSEGDIAFKRFLPFTMRLQTRQYPIDKILKEVGGNVDSGSGHVTAEVAIDGMLSGGASAIRMEGAARFPLTDVQSRAVDFSLSGSYEKGSLGDLELSARSGGLSLNLLGTLSRDGPQLDLSLRDEDLANWREVPGMESLDGSVNLSGSVEGTWENIQASLDLELVEPSLGRFRGDLLQAHLDMDRTGLSLPMLTMKAGAFVLVGRASISREGDDRKTWLNMSVTDGQIEDLLGAADLNIGVTGKLGGNVYLSASRAGWEGECRLSLKNGRILEEPFEEIGLAGSYAGGLFTADSLTVVKDGRRLEGSGNIQDGAYRVRFRSLDPVSLEGIRYLKIIKVPLGGELSLKGEASGKLDGTALRARTELDWDRINYEGRSWRSGKADFIFNGPELVGKGELLDGEVSVDVTVDLKGDFPFSGTISTPGTIDRAGINDFIGVGIPDNVASGRMSVRADAAGILKNVNRTRVKGTITDADVIINGIRFTSYGQIPMDYFPETGINFSKLPLLSGGSVIDGTLRIAPDAGIDGSVDGSIDLTGLTFLEPTVDSFSGRALTQLQVTGTLSDPVLNGSIELSGTSCVAHLPFPLPVDDLKGKLEIVGNRLHIGEIQGKPEAGAIWMSGELFMNRFKPVQGSFMWRAEGVPVNFPEGLDTVNRGDLGLKFSEGRGFLRGTIYMDQGTYNREVNIDNLIALIGERNGIGNGTASEYGEKKEGKWLSLDVEMVTASPIEVNMKLIRGKASGNLHLRGTASAPVLSGRLEMTEGNLEYRGHVFNVTTGTVGFINPKRIEPSFDFSGRTEVTGFDREGVVTDYTVELIATGVPEKFRLNLVSSPALSEADIAALLTFGAVGEKAFASRAGLSAAEATLLLTRELKGKLETEVEKVTGFDRFTINPSSVSASGERTTRIQVDKKLSEKFYLTYSTPVLASEEQEVLVKYRITRSLSLVGEQQGERDFGLDLDFQFELP